jgi:hypothetical protein
MNEHPYFFQNAKQLSTKYADTYYLNDVKNTFFCAECISSLQPLDQRIIRSFKLHHRQCIGKAIPMVDHKLLYDVTLVKVNVLDASFIVEPWYCVTHATSSQ